MTIRPKRQSTHTRDAPDLSPLDRLIPCIEEAIGSPDPIEDSLADTLDLSNRNISSLILRNSVFRDVSLANTTIRSIRLKDVRFIGCDLSNSTMRGFEATRVEFVGCRLMGMKAIEARWSDVLLEDCDARYVQLNSGQFRVSACVGSNLSESDLRNTDLEATTFTRSNLTRADLSGAKLRTTDLRGAEIEGVILRVEDVRGAIVNAAQTIELARLMGVVVK